MLLIRYNLKDLMRSLKTFLAGILFLADESRVLSQEIELNLEDRFKGKIPTEY